MLDKQLLKKGNKRREKKNWKNIIIAKTGVGAAYLPLKIASLPIKPIKTGIVTAKYAMDFYTFLRYAILSWTKKMIG